MKLRKSLMVLVFATALLGAFTVATPKADAYSCWLKHPEICKILPHLCHDCVKPVPPPPTPPCPPKPHPTPKPRPTPTPCPPTPTPTPTPPPPTPCPPTPTPYPPTPCPPQGPCSPKPPKNWDEKTGMKWQPWDKPWDSQLSASFSSW